VRGSDNPYPSLLFEEHVDPANPAAGHHRMFVDTDKALKMVDSAGTVTVLGAAGGAVATDPIWAAAGDLAVGTGNDTAGVLTKGAAGGVLAMGNSAVIWNAGTSFPGSKATGDRYWRTDLGMEFYWDGTRWVSTTLYRETMAAPAVATPMVATGPIGRSAIWHTEYDLWIVKLYTALYPATTNDGSKYWTLDLNKKTDIDGATSIAQVSTAAYTVNLWTTAATAVGAAVVQGTYHEMDLFADRVGATGALYFAAAMTYRLIGT